MTTPTADAARAVLTDLVAFDTTSHRSNLDLIAYAEDRLSAAGARTRRIASPDGRKANLVGVIGPDAPGGIVLSGHTDVVPVEGQNWSTDPWTLTEKDGRLYGRGTCDMKGFLACALAAADAFAAARSERPVVFALSYDEEVGCLGAPAMIDDIARTMPGLEAVIVGEPTSMKVVTGHKGLRSFEIEITGKEAHSSLVHQGACAVTHAAPIIAYLAETAEALREAAPADSPFDPPHGTLTIGTFHGGEALNILAGSARIGSLMRPAPWDDPDAVEAGLRAVAASVEAAMRRSAPEARVTVTQRSAVPPFAPETDGAAERLARALTGDNATRVVSYGTEAGQFQTAGVSTVVCGPGSIEQAHQPDEFIACEQLEAGTAFMACLAERLATDAPVAVR